MALRKSWEIVNPRQDDPRAKGGFQARRRRGCPGLLGCRVRGEQRRRARGGGCIHPRRDGRGAQAEVRAVVAYRIYGHQDLVLTLLDLLQHLHDGLHIFGFGSHGSGIFSPSYAGNIGTEGWVEDQGTGR